MAYTCDGKHLLKVSLTCGFLMTGWYIGRRLGRNGSTTLRLTHRGTRRISGHEPVAGSNGVDPALSSRKEPRERRSVRNGLYQGAAILSLSTLADSLLEHYHGCYFNEAMYIAPGISALVMAEGMASSASGASPGTVGRALFGAATLTGTAGLVFHFFNVIKREGGWGWLNLFYGAPLGAPGALAVAGFFGWCAEAVDGMGDRRTARFVGLPAGPSLAAVTVMALAGTVAEAWLLHFRGAYHNPFMFVPVTLPVAAGAALSAAAMRPHRVLLKWAAGLLKATGLAGIIGSAFHTYGIQRNMGGWGNAGQMVFQGPPLPAPIGFTGLARVGLVALELLAQDSGTANQSVPVRRFY